MSRKESSLVIIILTLIGVGMILLLLGGFISTHSPLAPKAVEEAPRKNNHAIGYDFYIYNYLKNHEIRIEIVKNKDGNNPYVLVDRVTPGERYGITKRQSLRAFAENSLTKVYSREVVNGEPVGDWKLYTTLRVNLGGIKSLRIGMVTTEWSAGDAGHSVQQAGTGSVQGMPHIRIHNLAEVPLSLNHNIYVAPKESVHYRGEHAMGVSLGLILRDNDGYYPVTQINKPVTDVYFGSSSDISQGTYGGLSYTPHGIENNEVQWDGDEVSKSGIYLLEDGWY